VKRFLFIVASLVSVFICVSSSFAKPVSLHIVVEVGKTHLRVQEESWGKGTSLAPKVVPGVQGYSISEVRELKADGEILAYILDLDPEGCIVISSDTDIRPVIAYSFEGRFSMEDAPDNVFLHLLEWDIRNRLEALPTTSERLKTENNGLWDKYLTQEKTFIRQLSSSGQWGPWLFTHWHQDDPYNKYCPKDPTWFSKKSAVGCTAIAMAQIIYYWGNLKGHPHSVEFNYIDDHYITKRAGIKIDEDADGLGFLNFDGLNDRLSDIKYDGNEDEIHALCFACGISLGMDYGAKRPFPLNCQWHNESP